MKKKRILWMSDTPTFFTGFGTVTREVLHRLSPHYTVGCLGWGHDGWPYDRDVFPYDIYPTISGNFGRDTSPRVVQSFQPDVVVAFGDLWMIDWVDDIAGREHFKSVLYFPMDGYPFPNVWRPLIERADAAVAYSKFAQSLAAAACPDTTVSMIYHGVDVESYRPLPRDALRTRHGLAGKFVVGCVARNQPRKHLPILIKAFARFAETRPDAFLFLHTNPDDIGWDILALLRRYGIEHRTGLSRMASVAVGMSAAKLNEIYNLFDVMALPTAGEGFGLPILEAMAAGVPVVATRCSACVELVEGRGELIDVKGFLTVGPFNLEHAIPDEDDLVNRFELLYADPERRQRCREAGLEFARTMSWEAIIEQWRALLDRL
jgi:glycosyltransferase involved in cell wall biosynthesis